MQVVKTNVLEIAHPAQVKTNGRIINFSIFCLFQGDPTWLDTLN
jgi:hypothetical protein